MFFRSHPSIHTHDVWKPTLNITDIVCPVPADRMNVTGTVGTGCD